MNLNKSDGSRPTRGFQQQQPAVRLSRNEFVELLIYYSDSLSYDGVEIKGGRRFRYPNPTDSSDTRDFRAYVETNKTRQK
jgi:hypothetical protein